MDKAECDPIYQPCKSPLTSQSSNMSDYMEDTIMDEDLGNLYIEIMHVCQPFYAQPMMTGNETFNIPPRLEDGLVKKKVLSSADQENPQDPMAACYRCVSEIYAAPTRSDIAPFPGR